MGGSCSEPISGGVGIRALEKWIGCRELGRLCVGGREMKGEWVCSVH